MSTSRLSRFLRASLGKQGGQVGLLLLACLGLYFFAYRGGRFFLVPSASMEPTLLEGDQIVTLRESVYGRGDVVVLRDPEDEKAYIVKRIMAAGGDTILVAGGAVYVNGSYVSEPYILSTPDYEMRTYSVPEGHVFLLGDNRNNSEDSHLWKDKARPVNEIIGKVRFIYFPFNRFGFFQGYPPMTLDRDLLEQRPGVL